nr:MAG TPA: hypothetical protein [Caudoviricetes sp.]
MVAARGGTTTRTTGTAWPRITCGQHRVVVYEISAVCKEPSTRPRKGRTRYRDAGGLRRPRYQRG